MAQLSVRLAEMKFSSSEDDIVIAHGLGSCIGLIIYDISTRMGGMAHVVLPDSKIQLDNSSPIRFADTAVPAFLKEFMMRGGSFANCFIKIAGGANMMMSSNASSMFNIGEQNTVAVREALRKLNLKVVGEDVGGTNGRTVKLFINDGRVTSRMIGMEEREL